MTETPPETPEMPNYRSGWIADIVVALNFLTRIPVQPGFLFDMSALTTACRCFPLIGVLIGGLSATIFLIAYFTGLPLLLAALLCVATQILLTGALHEDAIGDVADGFGGGTTREKKLEIMRDSRVGTYAVVMLILMIGMKVVAISSFENPFLGFSAILAASVCSRGAMVWAMHLMPTARKDGLGAKAGKPALTSALWALVFTVLIPLIVLDPFLASIGLLAAFLAALILGFIAYRQIGGQSGDVLGSIQQISELGFLLALVSLLR